MKKIFAISIIFLICTIGKTATDSNNTIMPDFNNTAVPDTNTTADCLEKIKQLEQVIESQEKRLAKITDAFNNLKKQLDEQIKEKERLKALPPKDKINSVVPAASFDPNDGIIYHGKKRDLRWFNLMYGKFRDKICAVEGKYYHITENLSKSPDGLVRPYRYWYSSDIRTWLIGTLVMYGRDAEVLSVLGDGEVLILDGDSICHIKGLDGKFADGQVISNLISNMRFIYAGTFEYTAANSGHKTVPSLVVYKPLTKEQFAEAINSGFELTGIK
jgi:hypothetical protein